jgi:hypothetical protein
VGIHEGLAERLASHDCDLPRLDRTLAALLSHISDYCHQVRKAIEKRDEQKRASYNRFLFSTLYVFDSYKSELEERGLSKDLFPLPASRTRL